MCCVVLTHGAQAQDIGYMCRRQSEETCAWRSISKKKVRKPFSFYFYFVSAVWWCGPFNNMASHRHTIYRCICFAVRTGVSFSPSPSPVQMSVKKIHQKTCRFFVAWASMTIASPSSSTRKPWQFKTNYGHHHSPLFSTEGPCNVDAMVMVWPLVGQFSRIKSKLKCLWNPNELFACVRTIGYGIFSSTTFLSAAAAASFHFMFRQVQFASHLP